MSRHTDYQYMIFFIAKPESWPTLEDQALTITIRIYINHHQWFVKGGWSCTSKASGNLFDMQIDADLIIRRSCFILVTSAVEV